MRSPKKHLRIGVVGSRTFSRLDLVAETVRNFGRCVIVSGGAKGVDTAAEKEARRLGYPEPVVYLPNWKQHKKAAGMIRNRLIVEDSDGLIIFWDGVSPGTKGTMELAKQARKPYILVMAANGMVLSLEKVNW